MNLFLRKLVYKDLMKSLILAPILFLGGLAMLLLTCVTSRFIMLNLVIILSFHYLSISLIHMDTKIYINIWAFFFLFPILRFPFWVTWKCVSINCSWQVIFQNVLSLKSFSWNWCSREGHPFSICFFSSFLCFWMCLYIFKNYYIQRFWSVTAWKYSENWNYLC